jgi:pyridoxamine 5'-phosphate oxidase-like protein
LSEQERPRRRAEPTRPHAPGYGIRSSGEGMLPWSHVDERMAQARNYWVATTRPDGRPHCAPVWGVWVNGTFYFGSGPRSRKARNLSANPNVVVHLESGDDVVILEGIAEEFANPEPSLFARIADAYATKYLDPESGQEFRPSDAEGIYAVRPRVAFGWLERDFPRTATRWSFR